MSTTDLRASLTGALPAALKAHDRVAVSALRSALSAVANAEAVPVEESRSHHTGVGASERARRDLTPNELRAVVEAEAEERESAAPLYERAGALDHAERARAEAAVIRRFLRADAARARAAPQRRPGDCSGPLTSRWGP